MTITFMRINFSDLFHRVTRIFLIGNGNPLIHQCQKICYNRINKNDVVHYSTIVKGISNKSAIWKETIDENRLHRQREEFNEYIKSLEKLKFDFQTQSKEELQTNISNFESILKYKDKIFEMAVLLKCSPDEAYKVITKHNFLRNSKPCTLKKKMNVVIGGGIQFSELKRDLWVLSYTVDNLQARIDQIKQLNLPIKCWMLRCQKSVLERTWINREENKTAMLPFPNSQAYLRDRLNLNECQFMNFTRKHPAVLKVKNPKLKEVLNYLLNEGFTAAQIYSTPRILCHSLTTIKNRLYMLRVRNHKPHTLSLLCKSSGAFTAYIQRLDKTN